MANAVEIANAYIALSVKAPGVQDEITKVFAPGTAEADKQGQKAGANWSGGLKKALIVGAAAVAAGTVAAFKGLYDIGATFDDVTDTIRTGTGATGAALKGLEKVAKDVGKSVPADFSQIGQVVADLNTRTGLSGKTLTTVAKQYLEAGRILGQDVDINSTTAAFNAFNIKGADVAKGMDSLFRVSQATGLGMNELAKSVQSAAPAMQNLGFSFEDTAALAGSLDKAGLNTQQVLMSMSKGMVTLAKDGEEPRAAFARVTEELQTFIKNGDTASALDLAGKVFGTRGASQFVGALQSGSINLKDLQGALGATGDTILGVGKETADFAEKAKVLGNKAMVFLEPLGSAVFAAMGNVLDQVTPLMDQVPAAFEAVKRSIGDVTEFVKSNLTWIGPMTTAILGGAAAWGAWTLAVKGWQAATKAGAAIQAAFNAVMAANPVMLVVTAIGALVAGLVYFFTQTELGQQIWGEFTRFLGEAWANITGFFTAAWENVIQPIFQAIGDIAVWLYENAIKPAFDGIVSAVQFVGGVVKFIGDLVVNYFRFWGAVGTWLYEKAIKPALDGIGAAFNWVWLNVIKPVTDGIAAAFNWLWANVISPVIDYINSKIQGLGMMFDWLYKNIIQPVWKGIEGVLKAGWNWIDANVFTPFKTGIDLIAKGFEIAKSSIEKTWDGIKRAAAVPINFVLDTVWNNGLRSFWNDLVTELGLKDMKLAKAPLVKFATGGVLPGYTPGRDVHQFYSPTGGRLALSGGEAIMRPEFTRLVGGKSGVDALNAAARSGVLGFANGGVWGEIGNFAGDVWDNIANAARVAGEFLADPAGAIQKHVIEGIIRPLLGGQNFFGKTIGQLPINLVKNLAKSFGGATGKGTAGMGWKAMQDIVLGNIKGARITSGYRSPVGNAAVGGAKGSYHMQGRAIDIVPASMATFNAVRRLFPNAAELIYTPAGAAQLRNGKPFAGWSSKVKAQHYNHVHLAMANGGVMPQLYDQGGWLPHGGIAVNQSGKPEPILTNDQWRMLGKGGLQAGDRIVIEVEGTPLTGTVKRVLDAEFASSSPEAMASEFPSR